MKFIVSFFLMSSCSPLIQPESKNKDDIDSGAVPICRLIEDVNFCSTCQPLNYDDISFEMKRDSVLCTQGLTRIYNSTIKEGLLFTHYEHDYENSCNSLDFFVLNNTKYYVDSLNISINNDRIAAGLMNLFKLKFHSFEYLIINFSDLSISSNDNGTIILLFDITNISNPIFNGSIVTSFFNIEMINDYNEDSKLDFPVWNYGDEDIRFYTMEISKLIIKNEYFIPVIYQKEQPPCIEINSEFNWPTTLSYKNN